MIIRSLRLLDFRLFQDSTFSFSPRVTVIAGINGRGKTSILDAIALILARWLPEISPAENLARKMSRKDIRSREHGARIWLDASIGDNPVTFSTKTGYTPSSGQIFSLPRALAEELRRAYGDPTRSDDQAPIVVYYTTDRARYQAPRRTLVVPRLNQTDAYVGALSNRAVNFKEFIPLFHTWEGANERGESQAILRAQKLIPAIQRAVSIFLDEIQDVRTEGDPPRLVVTKQDSTLDLAQLSDGERSLIAILMDLIRRLTLANPGLDDPLQGAGVVLIDEIELHLHPKWQREIVEKLRRTFPRIQFILTTHSPFVVQTLREGELRLLGDGLDEETLQDPGEYANRGLEEVATKVMGIEEPNIVPRYTQMLDAAREYYRLLETAKPGDELQLSTLKVRLDELVSPFPDEPAYLAFLEVQRVASFREGLLDNEERE